VRDEPKAQHCQDAEHQQITDRSDNFHGFLPSPLKRPLFSIDHFGVYQIGEDQALSWIVGGTMSVIGKLLRTES